MTAFHFDCIEQNVKRMGNCISKISKDLPLSIEEFVKNNILFSNGSVGMGLGMLTGGTCMRFNSIKKSLDPIQTWT